MTKLSQINKLRERGYTKGEIVKLTGISPHQVDNATRQQRLKECGELELMARRLLYKVPTWWDGTTEEWRRVVRCNFADVLEPTQERQP